MRRKKKQKRKMGTVGSKMGRKFEQKRKAKWVEIFSGGTAAGT